MFQYRTSRSGELAMGVSGGRETIPGRGRVSAEAQGRSLPACSGNSKETGVASKREGGGGAQGLSWRAVRAGEAWGCYSG